MKRLLCALLPLLLWPAGLALAQRSLSVDLARDRVSITSGFSGTDLLLFGAVDQPSDIVVVVTSLDTERQTVVRKQRIFGIWLNRGSAEFSRVPPLYTYASTRPLADVAPRTLRKDNRLGLEFLDIEPQDPTYEDYRAGLIRAKQRLGLYSSLPAKVDFKDERLFRTTLHFPAQLAPGRYRVKVVQLRNGRIVESIERALLVDKVGLGATISYWAERQGLLYGLFAITVAAMAGLLSGYAFRRT
jgi:uncharacterized protein (TIGR02186 family)